MGSVVTHEGIWKPSVFGGVTNTTLCGVFSGICANAADMNVGETVTCKKCLKIKSGEVYSVRLKYVGKTYQEIEAMNNDYGNVCR